MSRNLTHNENTKDLDDVSHHLKHKAECMEATKPKHSDCMAYPGSHKASRPKCKKSKIGVVAGQVKKGLGTSQHNKRGKHRKNKSKLECFNCRKKCHFTCDCTKPNKVHFDYSHIFFL